MCLLAAKPVFAQNTSSHTAVLGFSPGGISDFACRAFWGEYDKLNQSKTTILNRPGAGGTLSLRAVTNNEADVLCIGTSETLYQGLDANIQTNSLELVEMIGVLVHYSMVLYSSVPASLQSLDDLRKMSLKKIEPLKIGVVTSLHRYVVEYLARQHNFNVKAINYRGIQETVPDLLSGQLDLVLEAGTLMHQARPFNQDGKLVYLGFIGSDIPDMLKKGANFSNELPDLHIFQSWMSIAVAKTIDAKKKQNIIQAYQQIMTDPQFIFSIQKRFPSVVLRYTPISNDDIQKTKLILEKALR